MSEYYDIRAALDTLVRGEDLSRDEMISSMRQIMTGNAGDAQIGAFLMGLYLKGESLDEIEGAVEVMRELSTKVPLDGPHLVDIVGTGGDGANLFNISTAAAIVVAAAGGRVAKHGNRSVSSTTGSADVLEAAGVRLGIAPEQVAACVDELGIGFMFAPAHHSAMRHAIGPRRELGMRTIFNIVGPLTNPAGVQNMLIGVFDVELCRPLAEVMGRLGAEHVMVVHSEDGLDEISLAAPTFAAQFRHGVLEDRNLTPEDFGTEAATLDGLEVKTAEESLALIRSALTAEADERALRAARLIALNAGAALYVAGLASGLSDGFTRASKVIADGSAWARLEQLAAKTQSVQ